MKPFVAAGTLLPLLGLWGCRGAAPNPVVPPPPAARAPAPTQPPPPAAAPSRPVAGLPAPARQITRLQNGLTLAVTTIAPGRTATLQFAVPAGAALVAPGAGELAAVVLADGADPSSGRPSLRQAVASLGGTLEVHVGPLTAWVDLRVPGSRWQEALRALHDALAHPLQSRHQIERIRERHVAAQVAAVRADPMAAAATALLLGDHGPADRLRGLVDRDPGEIALFASRLHRPDGALLAVAVPADAETVTAELGRAGSVGLATWAPPPPVPGPTPLLERAFPSGLHWAPALPGTPGPRSRVAIVAMLPDPRRPDAAELFLLHACFTLDGAGGRLEQLQRERQLGDVRWRPSLAHTPDATALVLAADVPAGAVGGLWRTIQLARESLRDVPPNDSELSTARARVPLTARLCAGDAGARLRWGTMLQVASTDFAAIDRRAAQVAGSRDRDLRGAVDAFLALPLALVVVGGDPPVGLPVQRFELLPATAAAPLAGETPPAGGDAWIEGAIDAAGGHDLLRRLRGFDAAAEIVHEQAPPMSETVAWTAGGDLERTRRLLGETIETTLRGAEWVERVGAEVRPLDAREAAVAQRELRRHPLALLAAAARGEIEFRTVAVRSAADRTVAVLEAVGAEFDRLRLHVDTDSYLVRAVESWEQLPDGTVVHLHEAWRDYRTSVGLRAPFHRLVTQDDGQNRVETRFTRWTPRFGGR